MEEMFVFFLTSQAFNSWLDGWRQMETTWCVAAVSPAAASRNGRNGWQRMMVR